MTNPGIVNPNLPGPVFVQFFSYVLDALRALGGSARPSEVRDWIVTEKNVDETAIDHDVSESGVSRFDSRVGWARFYLAKAGLIDASRRGVWSLTERGRENPISSHDDALAIFRSVQSVFQENRNNTVALAVSAGEEATAPDNPTESTVRGYRQELLDILRELPASGFERICQRILREAGFQEVSVTGRSGDGGIDGIGLLQVNPLVSFKVLFQSKRYRDGSSVTASQVRDFRGAMMGRADKGIIITTGAFTADAKKEAVRDGVPPIELMDSEKLLDMLEQLELGLRPVTAYEIEREFFDAFRN